MGDEWIDTHGHVPRWVKKECGRIWSQNDKGSESFLNKYWIVEGRHFAYRIEFVGQHGSTTVIYKKRRQKIHKKRQDTSMLGKVKAFLFGKK
jgi:hypothetical protein